MKQEYGVDTILEPLGGYNTARWAEGGWECIDEATVRYWLVSGSRRLIFHFRRRDQVLQQYEDQLSLLTVNVIPPS